MIEEGYAYPHHGHSKDAVKASAELAKADQALLDKAAEAEVEAQKVAEAAVAEKYAEQEARHQAEVEARKPRKRT